MSEAAHDGQHHFRVGFERIQIFLFEDDRDSERFQFAYVIQAVDRISRESRQGFCKSSPSVKELHGSEHQLLAFYRSLSPECKKIVDGMVRGYEPKNKK